MTITAQDVMLAAPSTPPQTTASVDHFVCHTGYTPEKCHADLAVLRKVLAKYPIGELGEWTWVLIRSEDWKAVVQPRGLNPESPAFTYYEKHETFIEEALVSEVAGRRGELLKAWHMSMHDLLDFAVAHELGHALCNEKDEGQANRMARLLSEGKPIACESQTALAPFQLPRLALRPRPHPQVPFALPFRLSRGYLIIVKGSIGNLKELNFLIDTGAYPSVVDQRIAHNLGLTGQSTRVNLSNKTILTELVVLTSLVLGPTNIEVLPVLSQDLSYVEKELGLRVDAIVGMDVLSKSSFILDYRAKVMIFGKLEKMTFSTAFETYDPIVTVRLEAQRKHLRVVINTGGPDVMLFQSRVPDSSGFQALGTEKISNAGGTFTSRRVRIPDVYLGEESIGSLIGFVVDDHKVSGDNFDGLLGIAGKQFWKIAFDFEDHRFYWEHQN
jgi:hypothetical protein